MNAVVAACNVWGVGCCQPLAHNLARVRVYAFTPSAAGRLRGSRLHCRGARSPVGRPRPGRAAGKLLAAGYFGGVSSWTGAVYQSTAQNNGSSTAMQAGPRPPPRLPARLPKRAVPRA